jgi:hypothetical protein
LNIKDVIPFINILPDCFNTCTNIQFGGNPLEGICGKKKQLAWALLF